MLQSAALSGLPGIRHAFFTRVGGVSKGCYASLNGGVGSDDVPDHVAENRARMAATVGVAAPRLLTAYQVHSPTVVTAQAPWPLTARPKADGIVTRVPGLAVAVVQDGEVALVRAYGLRHAGSTHFVRTLPSGHPV